MTETTLSYCVKHSGQRPPWRGPIPWLRPDPHIDESITIQDTSYRVLDVAVSEPGHGWPQRHISAYVQREDGTR